MARAGRVRLLHLADVHLGAPLPWLGERGAAQRRQVRETFARALRQGLMEHVRAVVVAGDLFATPRPPRELAEFVAGQFGHVTGAGVPVVIAAGEADALEADGTYAGGALAGVPGVTVLPPTPAVVEVPDTALAVSGRSRRRGESGPWRLPAPATGVTTVGVGHVGVREAAEALAQARDPGLAYLALGGLHRVHTIPASVPAWYAGTPELVDRDGQGEGGLLVALGDGPPQVSALRLGRRRAEVVTLPAASLSTTDALAAALDAHADADLVLHVRLTGEVPPGHFLDVAAVRQRLVPRFFALEISDEATVSLQAPETGDVTVRGKFLALAQHRLGEARTPEEARRVAQAARLGLWLLDAGGQGS